MSTGLALLYEKVTSHRPDETDESSCGNTLEEFRDLYAEDKELDRVTYARTVPSRRRAASGIGGLDDDGPQFVEPRTRKGQTLMTDLTIPFNSSAIYRTVGSSFIRRELVWVPLPRAA